MSKRDFPPIHPGEILREEFLIPLGVSQYRLAKEIHVPARRINEIVLETNPEEETPEPPQVSFPKSYLKWVEDYALQDSNGWTVLTPKETYSISLADADYRVLAVREGDEYLLALVESSESGFYHAQPDVKTPVHVGKSFKSVLGK